MKFTCDRCGKRFSSVDEPLPGRVYRIRCKCGNTIEVGAPQAAPDAPRAKGGMPFGDPPGAAAGAAGGATPAGAGPARNETSPAPAAPPLRRGVLAGSAAFEAPIPRTSLSPRRPPGAAHPPPTLDKALLGDPFAAVPAPGAPAAPGARAASAATPSPFPGPDPGSTSSTRLPAPGASPAFGSPLPPLPPELELPDFDLPFPSDPPAAAHEADPFAVAAAHAALRAGDAPPAAAGAAQASPGAGLPERPAPRTPAAASPAPASPRTPAAASPAPGSPRTPAAGAPAPNAGRATEASPGARPPAAPVRPEPVPGAARDDESVELSTSEQYEIPHVARQPARPRSRSGPMRLVLAVAVAAAVGLAGAFGAWRLVSKRAAPPLPPPRAVAVSPVPPAPAPAAPPPAAPAPELAQPGPPTAAANPERPPQKKAERKATERKPAAERKPAEAGAEAERRAAVEKRVAAATAPPTVAQEASRTKAAPPAELPDGLDPAQMQTVIRANRAALEACVQKALSDPATSVYAGKKVSLIILVAPSGKAEAAIEDGDLDASAFGACVKAAAAKMSFPPFRGEPVGARVPLLVGRAE